MYHFKLGIVLGRFQNLHNSHKKLIDVALHNCSRVIIMVGSSQECMTERNPFNLYTRMNLIRAVYMQEIEEGRLLLAHIDDMLNPSENSTEWGDFLINKINMWKGHYGISENVDCFIHGDEDQSTWFTPEKIETVTNIVISRKSTGISATMARDLLLMGSQVEWENITPVEIHGSFEDLRDEILNVPYYKAITKGVAMDV